MVGIGDSGAGAAATGPSESCAKSLLIISLTWMFRVSLGFLPLISNKKFAWASSNSLDGLIDETEGSVKWIF